VPPRGSLPEFLLRLKTEFAIRFKTLEVLRLKNVGELQLLVDKKLADKKTASK
jgi:hypothetical protein